MPLSKDCPVCGYDHPIHTGPGDPDECIAYLGHVVRNLTHELAVLRNRVTQLELDGESHSALST
jgi:hypothetical protein